MIYCVAPLPGVCFAYVLCWSFVYDSVVSGETITATVTCSSSS